MQDLNTEILHSDAKQILKINIFIEKFENENGIDNFEFQLNKINDFIITYQTKIEKEL